MGTFKAEIGKFIQGQIQPPVLEAQVKAIYKDDPSLILTNTTDSKGHYKIGPVWNTADYQITVSKEGYEFKADSKNLYNYKSFKLSHLIIKFFDSETKEPLSDVLVSVSGVSNYRSNNIIDSTGVINFIGLVIQIIKKLNKLYF